MTVIRCKTTSIRQNHVVEVRAAGPTRLYLTSLENLNPGGPDKPLNATFFRTILRIRERDKHVHAFHQVLVLSDRDAP